MACLIKKRIAQSLCACLCLSGCSTSSHWHLSVLDSNSFASEPLGKLSYRPTDSLSGLILELYRQNGQTDAYLCAPSRRLNAPPPVKGQLALGDQTIEFDLSLHEGQMRAKLPDSIAARAIRSLQEGQPIVIIVGNAEQTFEPEHFAPLYQEFTKNGSILPGALKGLLPWINLNN